VVGVVGDSVDSKDEGCPFGGGCLEGDSGNGLKDLTEVGVALINGVGGQFGRGPSWGTFSFGASLSLSFWDPSLNLLRKAFMFFRAQAGVRRGS